MHEMAGQWWGRRPGWIRKLAAGAQVDSQCCTGILTLSARITVRWREMDLRSTPVSVRTLHIRRGERVYLLLWMELSWQTLDTTPPLSLEEIKSKHASQRSSDVSTPASRG